MKQRLSITINEEKVRLIEDLLKRTSKFRNKSHLIEFSLDKLMKEIENGGLF